MKKQYYKTKDFDYKIPDNLIAQKPAGKREWSQLFVPYQNMNSYPFSKIINYFDNNDVIIINETKVMHSRLLLKTLKSSKEHEVLFLRDLGDNLWEVMIRNSKRLKVNDELVLDKDLSITIIEKKGYSNTILLKSNRYINDIMKEKGEVPLPPYIKRENNKSLSIDKVRYQTVYSKSLGSAAAPTAGLHFTEEILKALQEKGVTIVSVILHVGIGTFLPVSVDNINEHSMHAEWVQLNNKNALILNQAKQDGKRLTAIGTTSLRVLESCFKNNRFNSYEGFTDIFITPPQKVLSVDRLITNFHQPKSTLLMLVCAFAGYEFVMDAYKYAIKKKLRFFSYGDSTIWENNS